MAIHTSRLDDFTLKLKDITDSIPNNLARYSFPFQDGESMDYMGEDARVVRFETVFRRETYKEHFDFVKHIRKGLIYTLKHPVYGNLKGRIHNPVINHKEYKNWVSIQFTFLEQLIDVELQEDTNIIPQIEMAYTEAVKENMQAFEDSGNEILEDDSKEVMSKDVNPSKSIIEQIIDVSFFTRKKLADLDRMLGVIDYWEDQITTPVDAIINTIDFGSKLPGRVIKSCTSVVERVATVKRKVNQFPSTFIASLNVSLTSLKDAIKSVSNDNDSYSLLIQTLDISVAQTAALHTAYIYDDDENKRTEYENTIDIIAFNHEGRRVFNYEDIEILNQNELENSLYLSRQLLGDALQYNRGILKSNKKMAFILENHVSNVKLKRDSIIDIDLSDNIVPLHALLSEYGLPHRYIKKIMAINNIENPTFTTGKVKLYARA